MSPVHKNVSTNCSAMSDVLNRIGDKWSVMVVSQLRGGPKRFSDIRRAIGGISQRMLTLTLRNLERDGLVTRTIYAQIPPRVDYELTPLGETLLPAIGALWDWATSNYANIQMSRRDYDARDGQPRMAAE